MTTPDTLRNADLSDLANLLREQNARKLDVVAPSSKITARDGLIVIEGTEPILTADGVTVGDGVYRPTAVADEQMAEKLGIPVPYLRKMRMERPDLYDANVNGWLHGHLVPTDHVIGEEWSFQSPPDPRSFLARMFRGDGVAEGVLRAFLSDRYRLGMDNLDVLTAALDGVAWAGVKVDIVGADLSERRMRVRVAAPEVAVLAPDLLGTYRDPFAGRTSAQREAMLAHGWFAEADRQTVFAGFEFSNSETGGGALTFVPRFVVRMCSNGLTITVDAMRAVHLGGKLDEGVIEWSADTEEKQLAVITAKARDAVVAFLDRNYLQRAVDGVTERAGHPVRNAQATVQTVCKRLAYSEERTQSVLDLFIAGGSLTAGGVMQAVTAAAQDEADPDEAAQMEADGLRALDFAVVAAS